MVQQIHRSVRAPGRSAGSRRRLWFLGLSALHILGLLLWRLRQARHGVGVSDFEHQAHLADDRGLPLAPPALLGRCHLALELRRRGSFLWEATAPATTTRHAEQTIEQILEQLDQAPRASPGPLARGLARYTSYLKHAGIVGWADIGRRVIVEGWIDEERPVQSSDGMLTIDARIVRLWIDGEEVTQRLDGIRHLRVEVFAPIVRSLAALPRLHDCIRAEGWLRIDHDGLDFYELHVGEPGGLRLLDCGSLEFSREAGPRQPWAERLLLKLWPFD